MFAKHYELYGPEINKYCSYTSDKGGTLFIDIFQSVRRIQKTKWNRNSYSKWLSTMYAEKVSLFLISLENSL